MDPADADLYSTRQAAEDLEAFRDWLDADQLILYGESYGTRFQQTYAAAHPDRVEAMVLDGVVDLRTDVFDFGLQQAPGLQRRPGGGPDRLRRATRLCAVDAPGTRPRSSTTGWPRGSPTGRSSYDYPLPDGTTTEREFTLDDLHAAAAGPRSASRRSRMLLQQALNAAARRQLRAARPPRRGRIRGRSRHRRGSCPTRPGPDALYYAVQCTDHDVVPEGSTGREQLDVWLDAARRPASPDCDSATLPTATCPACSGRTAAPPRPGPSRSTDPPYPLLLLSADTDPNTPVRNAEQVFERTADACAGAPARADPT